MGNVIFDERKKCSYLYFIHLLRILRRGKRTVRLKLKLMLNLNERLNDLGQSGYCVHLAIVIDSVVHHENRNYVHCAPYAIRQAIHT